MPASARRPIATDPPVASAHQCRVYAFSCDDPEDLQTIAFLQGIAVSQKSAFVKIFPWDSLCKPNNQMYVSLAFPAPYVSRHPKVTLREMLQTPPVICGWLTASYEPKRRAVYINKLATRTPTDRTYSGVGQGLLAALESHVFGPATASAASPASAATASPANFIYLFPLDAAAAGFYDKAAYVRLDPTPENRNLFKVRPGAAGPSKAFLKSLRRPVEEMTDATEESEMLNEIKTALTPTERKRFTARLAADPDAKYVAKELYFGQYSPMSTDGSGSTGSGSSASGSPDGVQNVREWLAK